MKFVVSSVSLLNRLQTVSRVISPKNTLPILDNFLFSLSGNELQITASDLESTLSTTITLENASDKGVIAIPARLLIDTLKEFPDQPLSFEANTDSREVIITTENGQYTIMGQAGVDFPQLPSLKEDKKVSLQVPIEVLSNGIINTIFATADDELRPVMNGIFMELAPDHLTFVASDAHKLVRYRRGDIKPDVNASVIIPKKPSNILKNILVKGDEQVMIEFDDKNAFFTTSSYKLVCRLVEGNYPNYSSVIPTDNPFKVIVDRLSLYNSLKRVSVFSNQASNLVKLQFTGNQIKVSAQDIDFSISAYENIVCQFDGNDMEIGFKSTFLIEILANLESSDVVIELSDPSRAGIILPMDKENKDEDILMLLMPMMINT